MCVFAAYVCAVVQASIRRGAMRHKRPHLVTLQNNQLSHDSHETKSYVEYTFFCDTEDNNILYFLKENVWSVHGVSR